HLRLGGHTSRCGRESAQPRTPEEGAGERGAAGYSVVFGFKPHQEGGRSIQDRPVTLIAGLGAGAPARPPEREAARPDPRRSTEAGSGTRGSHLAQEPVKDVSVKDASY